jgi:hypothetical protein
LVFYPAVIVAVALVLVGLPSTAISLKLWWSSLHFQSPVLTRQNYVRPIGATVLERRILSSLWRNGYFISLNEKHSEEAVFDFRAIPPLVQGFSRMPFNVWQPKDRKGILVIVAGVAIAPNIQAKFKALTKLKKEALLYELRQELTGVQGIEFSGVMDPLRLIEIRRNVLLSSPLTEDGFYSRELLVVNQAITKAQNALDKHIG